MKKNILFIAAVICTFVLYGCEYDNYDEPAIVYQNQQVGVRSNATQLELWQDGYALRAKIPVYIAQDGTWQAVLFDGNYKIVRLSGAPWENQTDTISVTVRGNTVADIPVVPYFIIRNATFRKMNNTITVIFTIEKTSDKTDLALARLYLGKTIITDQNNNVANVALESSNIVLGQETTITATIPESLASADYLFARVGIQAVGIGELYYTSPQEIQLK